VIARKDGAQVRLWARTTSDYRNTFTRIRDAVAALPVDSAVLDCEAVVLRPDASCDFEALRSRQGQAEAILVAYDVVKMDGQDVRPLPALPGLQLLERQPPGSGISALRSELSLRSGFINVKMSRATDRCSGDPSCINRLVDWPSLDFFRAPHRQLKQHLWRPLVRMFPTGDRS